MSTAQTKRSPDQLAEDVRAIWNAALAAVRSDSLVEQHVRIDGNWLHLGDELLDLRQVRRLVVVGAGKAGAGMARGLERVLGEPLMADKQLIGWLNVPENCVELLQRIHLHGARPAGKNEPTEAGVEGTNRILQLVESMGPQDVCLCLLSGGGSALLPAPLDWITIADKQAVTKFLSGAGANIEELNTVRKQLSKIKGGGLSRACRAGRLVTLIISDVLGDPLDIIASGPTVPDSSTPERALEILSAFDTSQKHVPAAIYRSLRARKSSPAACGDSVDSDRVTTHVIGNNAVAVDAAGVEAERRGYSHAMWSAKELEGKAEDVGRRHAELATQMLAEPGPDCLITGGEPVVELAAEANRGLGGRNQQLVLAALAHLVDRGTDLAGYFQNVAMLACGTDGEDGPTDAAGAVLDAAVAARIVGSSMEPQSFLARNDAYHFFEAVGGLVKTGPTHTNVCDVRIVVVSRLSHDGR